MDVKALIAHGIEHFCKKKGDELEIKIVQYVNELFRWQKHINLTGFKEPETVVKKLIYEALFLIRYLRGRRRIVDMGSGSGAISVVLSLFLESDIYSVEKNGKKVSFQKHVKRMLNISNLHIIHASIEDIEPLKADAIFAKAFGALQKIVEKADRHLLSSGILLIPKSRKEEPAQIANYLLLLAENYKLPMDERENLLLIYQKI